MYLPAAIPFRDTASYENADLGMAGGIAEAGGKASEGLIQSLFSGVGQTAAAAFGGGAGEGLGRLAMTKVSVSKYLGGEGTALAVKQAAGVTMNPNTRSLFKSVALREFAFQFKFIPLSKQEHDTVIKIIGFFLLLSTLIAFLLVLIKGPVSDNLFPDVKYIKSDILFIIALMGWMPTAVDLSSWNSIWTLERIKQTNFKPTLNQTIFEFNIGYLSSAFLSLSS